VSLVALRTSFSESEFAHPALAIAPPPAAADLRRAPAVREWPEDGRSLRLPKKRSLAVAPEEHWPRFEEVALAHLLLYEDPEIEGLDRDALGLGRLEP
jgi:hypothetical protein